MKDMCADINCGIGGNCTGGNCTCQTGYEKIGNFCEDMCEGINCGPGADCLGGNCTCLTGYTNIEDFCVETCALNPCKELIKVSLTKRSSFIPRLIKLKEWRNLLRQ